MLKPTQTHKERIDKDMAQAFMAIGVLVFGIIAVLAFVHSIGVYWIAKAQRDRLDAIDARERNTPTVRISETELRAVVRMMAKEEATNAENNKFN